MLTLNKIYKISFQCYKLAPLRHFATTNASRPKPNYYKVLDIPEKATSAEIKAAFHKKAKEHHPDAQADRTAASKESEEKFKLAVEAYKILSDESKRKDYDESIKPPKPSSSGPGATAWSQDASSEGYSSSRTRYHNEKFYGDHTDYQQQNEGPYPQYASPHPKQDPRQAKRIWAGMDYENILIGGLMLALALRWTMFIWDTGDTRRVPYSEVEKLDPNDAEEEGVYIDVPKDQSRPLSIRDCQGLTMEQLDELDRMGYILPSSVKEEVMNYRETHKVYKKPKRATYWNYNNMYNEKMEPAPVVQGQAQRQAQQAEQDETTPAVPKPVKKKPQKSLKEIADDVKKDVVQNTNTPVKEFRPEDYAVVEKKEEKAVPPGEVKIPRMRANMYNLEKNS